jgi:tetratricopeptide (TPR) repeat protein
MMKLIRKAFLFSALLGLFFTVGNLYSQEVQMDSKQLYESSLASFEEGNYSKALNGFRKLMDQDKGNVLHRYYAGRCLVELNEDLEEAIELLYGAQGRNVPQDVTFYLGLAYHRYYNFREARKYYEKFGISASRQEKKEYNIKHQTATTRSAWEITSSYNPFEVMNVTFLDLHDSLQYSQVKMKGGQLSHKPEEYVIGDEDPEDLTNLMFIPATSQRGDFLYFSAYAKNGKGGAQLFRVRKLAGRSWSTPEEVSSLNTEGNEILPYFDPIEEDLYFASDGYLGIGGFDLYRSHYDRDRDQWSEPINLGFPVNSAMDEYLLLPGTDLGMVLFFSTRQGTDSTVTVYRVHLSEPRKKTAANDDKMLRDIAHLGGVAGDILAEIKNLEGPSKLEKREALAQKPVASAAPGPLNDLGPVTSPAAAPATSPSRKRVETETQSAYQFYLSEALTHQALSDSLKDLADDARRRVRESDDPNDKWVWQKQIMVWEKRARDEEGMADFLYAKMEEQKPNKASYQAGDHPESIEVDKVINDLTVYRFANPDSDQEAEAASEVNAPAIQSAVEPGSEPRQVPVNRFDILAQSPYSASNPIPMDVNLPRGTFYRIQLGAFGSMVEPSEFGGISPITAERLIERGVIKYYAGKFTRYQDASVVLPRIQSQGYEDAFIVAWYNGIQLSTQKAKQLE